MSEANARRVRVELMETRGGNPRSSPYSLADKIAPKSPLSRALPKKSKVRAAEPINPSPRERVG
jgi:hypothetical protein